jgi:uracil-DNA glycosylase
MSRGSTGSEEFTVARPPSGVGLDGLREAARTCAACPLAGPATQTVFGSGPADARVVLVGEQPGDVEDRRGEPFVGPAGRLLDKALVEAGIDRAEAYVTNAVKHFRFTRTATRRLHQTPAPEHIAACRPWLEAELALISPELVVVLGATAARALLGPSFRITRQRGQLMPFDSPAESEDAAVHSAWMVATIHPSAVLRMPADEREVGYQAPVADPQVGRQALA